MVVVMCWQGVKDADGAPPAAVQPGDMQDRESFSSKPVVITWLCFGERVC